MLDKNALPTYFITVPSWSPQKTKFEFNPTVVYLSLSLSLFAFQSNWKIKFKTRKIAKLRLKAWKKSVEMLKGGKNREGVLRRWRNGVRRRRKLRNFYHDVITALFAFVLARRFDCPFSFVSSLCLNFSFLIIFALFSRRFSTRINAAPSDV